MGNKKNETDSKLKLKQIANKVCWVQSKGKKWLYPQNMEAPNKQCFICQKSQIHLTLNPKLFNYGAFVKQILIKSLGFKQPDITIEYIEKDDVNKTGSNYLESIT